MTRSDNPYKVLGLSPTAHQAVVKAAYRALAQHYHPDSYSGDKEEAHAMMVRINLAYELIGNPSARARFDEQCATDDDPAAKGFSDPPEWAIACRYYPYLSRFSEALELAHPAMKHSYISAVLAEKAFSKSDKIPRKVFTEFMESRFGPYSTLSLAATCLLLHRRDSLFLELEAAARIIGKKEAPNAILNVERQRILDALGVEQTGAHSMRFDGMEFMQFGSVLDRVARKAFEGASGGFPLWMFPHSNY
jgi:curved DNA-binding protein CbpA